MDADPAPGSRLPLADRSLRVPGRGIATAYARALLESLGATVTAVPGPDDVEPPIAWARSGLMALTGPADGDAQMCPVPLASCADGVVQALRCLAPAGGTDMLPDGSALLGERAAIAGLRRHGAISPGGGCRLLRAVDGWFAITLARDLDWADVPAWLEADGVATWDTVAAVVATRRVGTLVERARLLGLAACASVLPDPIPRPWFSASRHGAPAPRGRPIDTLRVLDLSSLWAGPLCSHLLQLLGARVVKVETRGRPDGARNGPAAFHDLLNAGKRSVALDFDRAGMARLQALIDRSDVVIEGSRPRALRQLGIVAEDCIARRTGLTWVSITGYGRTEPDCGWTAFGDDAGVAAGLSALLQDVTGRPLICGDAIADPLAGMHAALVALAGHRGGGGLLLSLPLRDVAAHCATFASPVDPLVRRQRWASWTAVARAARLDATAPVARRAAGRARDLGADTEAVLNELALEERLPRRES
jgi:crotonobetainyl-CoA:carnitine CoA-transferase CaiB-like acyl-CoA transferase